MASTTDDAFGADDNSSTRIDAETAPNGGAQHDGHLIADTEADTEPAAAESDVETQPGDLLEREGEVAADYLEGLLDIIDVDGDIDMDVEGNRAVVSVIGDHLRQLVGAHGSVLDALQDLTRLAVAQETGERSRLMLDIAGHRAKRRAELTALATRAAEQASTSGEPVTLEPMTAFERKVVHDAVAAAGQLSESEGEEPNRRVVVLAARGQSAADKDPRTEPHEPVADQA